MTRNKNKQTRSCIHMKKGNQRHHKHVQTRCCIHIREIRYITENLDGGEEQDRTNFISSPAAGGIREELSRGQSARGHRCWYGLVHQCVQRSPSGSIRFCWFCSTQSCPIGRLRLVGQMAGQYGYRGSHMHGCARAIPPQPRAHITGSSRRGGGQARLTEPAA